MTAAALTLALLLQSRRAQLMVSCAVADDGLKQPKRRRHGPPPVDAHPSSSATPTAPHGSQHSSITRTKDAAPDKSPSFAARHTESDRTTEDRGLRPHSQDRGQRTPSQHRSQSHQGQSRPGMSPSGIVAQSRSRHQQQQLHGPQDMSGGDSSSGSDTDSRLASPLPLPSWRQQEQLDPAPGPVRAHHRAHSRASSRHSPHDQQRVDPSHLSDLRGQPRSAVSHRSPDAQPSSRGTNGRSLDHVRGGRLYDAVDHHSQHGRAPAEVRSFAGPDRHAHLSQVERPRGDHQRHQPYSQEAPQDRRYPQQQQVVDCAFLHSAA